MQLLKKTLDSIVITMTCTLLAIMVLMTLWQVFTRYVLNEPSTSSTEFLRYALIWESLLGSAYLFGRKQHLAITFLKEKLTNKIRHFINIIIEIVAITFALVIMVFGGGKAVLLTSGQLAPALDISMGYIYAILPITGLLIFIYSAINLVALVSMKEELIEEENKIESVM